jgi:hypothetical protein
VVLDIVDIDPDINYIPVHSRLLIVSVACEPLEVSINDGSPRVKKGASISSILRAGMRPTLPPHCLNQKR